MLRNVTQPAGNLGCVIGTSGPKATRAAHMWVASVQPISTGFCIHARLIGGWPAGPVTTAAVPSFSVSGSDTPVFSVSVALIMRDLTEPSGCCGYKHVA